MGRGGSYDGIGARLEIAEIATEHVRRDGLLTQLFAITGKHLFNDVGEKAKLAGRDFRALADGVERVSNFVHFRWGHRQGLTTELSHNCAIWLAH
jgi:hypothetical protein